jgi:transposase
MEQVTTIGLDLAKNVFQVHGIDDAGKVLDLECALTGGQL